MCTGVRVVGMDEFELNDLLTSLGPARRSRPLLSAVAAATDGNPLLVTALYRRLYDMEGIGLRGGEVVSLVGDVLPLALGLDAELRHRLAGVSRRCRDVLTWAAFLGDGGLLVDLEAVGGGEFDALLEEAEATTSSTTTVSTTDLITHCCATCCTTSRVVGAVNGCIWTSPTTSRAATPLTVAGRVRSPTTSAAEAQWSMAARLAGLSGRRGAVVRPPAWGAAARYFASFLMPRRWAGLVERAQLALRAGVCHFRDHDLPVYGAAAAGRRLPTYGLPAISTRGRAAALSLPEPGLRSDRDLSGPVDTSILEELVRRSRCRRPAGGARRSACWLRFTSMPSTSTVDRLLFHEPGGLRRTAVGHELATNVGLRRRPPTSRTTGAGVLPATPSGHRSTHAPDSQDPWKRAWGLGRLPLVELLRGDLVAADTIVAEATSVGLDEPRLGGTCPGVGMCSMQVAGSPAPNSPLPSQPGAVALQMYRRSDYSFVPMLVYLGLAALVFGSGRRGRSRRGARQLGEKLCGSQLSLPIACRWLARGGDSNAFVGARSFSPCGRRGLLAPVPTSSTICAQAEVGYGDR